MYVWVKIAIVYSLFLLAGLVFPAVCDGVFFIPESPGGSTDVLAAADLTAYDPDPRRAPEDDYLPEDESLTPGEVKELLNRGEAAIAWSRSGFPGAVLGGAAQVVEAIDAQTLGIVRSAFYNADSATLRPEGGGVGLNIRLSTTRE